MNIVASVEARMNSSRYPGKMIANINGKKTIERVFERLKASKYINKIILATTVNSNDDILCSSIEKKDILVHRGSEDDVFLRVYEAHKKYKSDIIITICGDCPLIDAQMIDKYLQMFIQNHYQILFFNKRHNYPQGTEFMIFSSGMFNYPYNKNIDKAQKEHVGLYFLENIKKYRFYEVRGSDLEKSYNNIRLQFDYKEDLILIRKIFNHFYNLNNPTFNIHDIINFLNKNTELINLNSHCIEKEVR
tara:strand:- start:389 stop:1129 length:741 start_codon:yes stop_codon:yes gene_type:complete